MERHVVCDPSDKVCWAMSGTTSNLTLRYFVQVRIVDRVTWTLWGTIDDNNCHSDDLALTGKQALAQIYHEVISDYVTKFSFFLPFFLSPTSSWIKASGCAWIRIMVLTVHVSTTVFLLHKVSKQTDSEPHLNSSFPNSTRHSHCAQWRTQEIFFSVGVQQIQLRTEDREKGDLGTKPPSQGFWRQL